MREYMPNISGYYDRLTSNKDFIYKSLPFLMGTGALPGSHILKGNVRLFRVF